MSVMTKLFKLPGDLMCKKVAAGRNGASRWEIYAAGTNLSDPDASYAAWLGDLVWWIPEGVWDWQPREGDPDTYPDAAGAVAAIRLHVHDWQETDVSCDDCGSHPGLRCSDPMCDEVIDLIRDDDPREVTTL